MRTVFLDIDGVVATRDTYALWGASTENDPTKRIELLFDPKCTQRVRDLCVGSGATVVVSSSWRFIHPLEELQGFLAQAGLPPELVRGCIPRDIDYHHRGKEIGTWMQKEGLTPKDVVILDDDSDAGRPHRTRFIRTHMSTGFRDRQLKQALALFP